MDVLQGLMQQLVTALAGTSGWIQSHLAAISTAIVTTLLVIFGEEINGFIKKQIRNYNFFRAHGSLRPAVRIWLWFTCHRRSLRRRQSIALFWQPLPAPHRDCRLRCDGHAGGTQEIHVIRRFL